jgi:hypothetical protein
MSRIGRARFLVLVSTPLLVGTFSRTAHAGFLKVTEAEPGSMATIEIFTDDVPSTLTGIVTKEGTFTFGLGSLAEEEKIKEVKVTKTPKGQHLPQTGSIIITPGKTTLASLEPFSFPGFTANVSLVANMDIIAFLSHPDPFTLGEALNVTDGTIPQTASIMFTENSSPFTGTVTVSSFDNFSVPEPGSLALLGIGTLGLMVFGWRHRQLAAQGRVCSPSRLELRSRRAGV